MKDGLTLMEERFCQLVALGSTARAAYSEAFSIAITDKRREHSVDNRAGRLAKRPDIVERIAELAGEAMRQDRRMWEQRGRELAERVYNGVLKADAKGKILSQGALKGIEVLAKMKGLNAPDETVLRNGGMAEDAFVPRGVEGMSDEDLRAIIAQDAGAKDAAEAAADRTIDV